MSSSLRQRAKAADRGEEDNVNSTAGGDAARQGEPPSAGPDDDEGEKLPQKRPFNFGFGLLLLPVAILVGVALLTWHFVVTRQHQQQFTPESIWTAEQLALFNGSDSSRPLLLAIIGDVFDVTAGKKHYGPDGGYNHFCGRDASRAFISGNFSGEGLTDDVSGFTNDQLVGLKGWRDFYFKTYKHVGKLCGRYYDQSGAPTKQLRVLVRNFKKAEEALERQKAEEKKHPGCNSRWSSSEGGVVWCESGYPRKVFRVQFPVAGGAPLDPATRPKRCACFQEDELDLPGLTVYDDCDPYDNTCVTSPPQGK